MKKLLIALLFPILVIGQSDSFNMKDLLVAGDSLNVSAMYLKTPKENKLKANSFIINGRDVSEILLIDQSGEIWFKPSFFCSCKKCKKFQGMKKLKR